MGHLVDLGKSRPDQQAGEHHRHGDRKGAHAETRPPGQGGVHFAGKLDVVGGEPVQGRVHGCEQTGIGARIRARVRTGMGTRPGPGRIRSALPAGLAAFALVEHGLADGLDQTMVRPLLMLVAHEQGAQKGQRAAALCCRVLGPGQSQGRKLILGRQHGFGHGRKIGSGLRALRGPGR